MSFSKASKLFLLAFTSGTLSFAQIGAYAVMPGPEDPGTSRSYAWVASTTSPNLVVTPGPGSPCGTSEGNICYYLPSNLVTAYAVNFIASANGGAGRTVAVVDAYYNSQTAADLATYSTQWGLPACTTTSGCLTIVSQTGTDCTISPGSCATSNTFNGHGWALETDLDLQAVHSLAPNAHILLVTAASNGDADLYTAVTYAYAHADVVSNSWGSAEFSAEGSFESLFSASHVPIVFSSGDTGAVAQYPCMSQFTLCVGGTKLLTTATSYRSLESAWGGSDTNGGGGGGCSAFINQLSAQSGFSTAFCGTFRGAPDVAAVADPYTGFVTYLGPFAAFGLSSTCSASSCPPGFYVIGGTSLAAPLTAAIIADIDADRVAHGKGILTNTLNSMIYQAAVTSYHYRFYDVTMGSTGFPAGTGWDQATGLGVMLGPALATYLLTLP